jgi:hypothetical protein
VLELLGRDPEIAGGGSEVSLMQSMHAVAGMDAPLPVALAGRGDGGEGAAGDHDGYGRCGEYLLSSAPSQFEQCSLVSLKTYCPPLEWYVKLADRPRIG